jgi:hypothetical protein
MLYDTCGSRPRARLVTAGGCSGVLQVVRPLHFPDTRAFFPSYATPVALVKCGAYGISPHWSHMLGSSRKAFPIRPRLFTIAHDLSPFTTMEPAEQRDVLVVGMILSFATIITSDLHHTSKLGHRVDSRYTIRSQRLAGTRHIWSIVSGRSQRRGRSNTAPFEDTSNIEQLLKVSAGTC